jgi:excisionase family DNA binding protein
LTGPVVTLVGADGVEVQLPAAAREVLAHAADAMSRGMAVYVSPAAARLTTGEAAELLGVSRPTVVKLLESGAIPFEKTTSHRRVRLDDVLVYRERRRAERRATLDEMTRQAIEDGLYDA